MSDILTPNLGLTKPDVGGSDDTWGEKLNGNFDILDLAVSTAGVSKAYVDAQDALREPAIVLGTTIQYWRGDKSWQVLDKAAVGLGNVDNTSDANKPVSSATQTALNLKANIASPTFTGNPAAPTPSPGDNDTSIATTAFVTAALAAGGGGASPSNANPIMDGVAAPGTSALYSRGDHVHPTDTSRAPLASPVFTGNPTAPTPVPGDNDTSIATTAFVTNAVVAGGGASPSNTNPIMDGIAAPGTAAAYSRGDHVHPSDTSRLAIAGGTMTGTLTLQATNPTGNNEATRKLYVDNEVANANANANQKVPLDGSQSMTGDLRINKSVPTLNLDATGASQAIIDGKRAAVNRWRILMPDSSAEGPVGSGNGSNFVIRAYSDDMATSITPLQITRANGDATFTGTVILSKLYPSMFLLDSGNTGASACDIISKRGGNAASNTRWMLRLGAGAEGTPGTNIGSDFYLLRGDDSGNLTNALQINRSNATTTFYGDILQTKGSPNVTLQSTDGNNVSLWVSRAGAVNGPRWLWQLLSGPEGAAGANTGSNCALWAYSDDTTPALRGKVLDISRNTLRVTLNGDPLNAFEAATKNYVDNKISKGGFNAYKTVNQTGVAINTFTKVTCPVEAFDRGGFYDAPNSRWTPPAGLVAMHAFYTTVSTTMANGSLITVQVFKNGARISQGQDISFSSGAIDMAPATTIFDYANGTDFYEMYCFMSFASGTGTIRSDSPAHCFFTGIHVGGP